MGLRWLRKPHSPVPLGMKDKDGRRIPFCNRAKNAAQFLGSVISGGEENQQQHQLSHNTTRIAAEDLGIPISDITMTELFCAIKKLKRNKAPGPDGLPVDCYKEMDALQLQRLLETINHWWNGSEIPGSVTQAKVIPLHKKGE